MVKAGWNIVQTMTGEKYLEMECILSHWSFKDKWNNETTLFFNEKLEHLSELREVVRGGQIPTVVPHMVSEIGPSFISA